MQYKLNSMDFHQSDTKVRNSKITDYFASTLNKTYTKSVRFSKEKAKIYLFWSGSKVSLVLFKTLAYLKVYSGFKEAWEKRRVGQI